MRQYPGRGAGGRELAGKDWAGLPSICFCFLALPLSLEDGGLSVNLADLLPCRPSLFGFTNLTNHSRICNIDFGLIRGPFVGFSAEEFEVLAAGGILEFFDVCIVAVKRFTLAKDGIPSEKKRGKQKYNICSESKLTFGDQIDSTRSARSQ